MCPDGKTAKVNQLFKKCIFRNETKNSDEIAMCWKEKLGRNVPRHSESSVCLVFPLKTKPVLP